MHNIILIVEDDENDLLLIRRALKKACVSNPILVIHDSVEALEMLLSGPRQMPDLPLVVLLDLNLPRIDGIEVLQQIRADPSAWSVPVVMLTSSDEQDDLLRSYRLGVNSYVRKPIDFGVFQKTVGELGLYWSLINCRLPL